MIISAEDKIKVIGFCASINGLKGTIEQILAMESNDNYRSTSRGVLKLKKLLLSSDNWGLNEQDWEVAIKDGDKDVIAMIVNQGFYLREIAIQYASNQDISDMLIRHVSSLIDKSIISKEDVDIEMLSHLTEQASNLNLYSIASLNIEALEYKILCAKVGCTNKSSLYKKNVLATHKAIHNKADRKNGIEPDPVVKIMKTTQDIELLENWVKSGVSEVREAVVLNRNTPDRTLNALKDDGCYRVRIALAERGVAIDSLALFKRKNILSSGFNDNQKVQMAVAIMQYLSKKGAAYNEADLEVARRITRFDWALGSGAIQQFSASLNDNVITENFLLLKDEVSTTTFRLALSCNSNDNKHLKYLIENPISEYDYVRLTEQSKRAVDEIKEDVRVNVALNPNTPKELLNELKGNYSDLIDYAVDCNGTNEYLRQTAETYSRIRSSCIESRVRSQMDKLYLMNDEQRKILEKDV